MAKTVPHAALAYHQPSDEHGGIFVTGPAECGRVDAVLPCKFEFDRLPELLREVEHVVGDPVGRG
jgi:hypothetical protein